MSALKRIAPGWLRRAFGNATATPEIEAEARRWIGRIRPEVLTASQLDAEPEECPVMTFYMQRRPDGGLRIWSDDPKEIVLSSRDPEKALADLWPALRYLEECRANA